MQTTTSTSKQEKLKRLASQISSCTACFLAKGRTLTVAGEGNPDSGVMIVGEAPGRNEDESGRPFVGMAGKFLDKLMLSAGLSRDDVFITNIVKCRPPDNRAPEKAEIEACAGFLKKQIDIVDPRLIICLGGTAAAALLGVTRISAERGKFIEREGRLYYIAYHPAARFHRRLIAEDFEMLKGLLPTVQGLHLHASGST